jgi:hypothetical protein
MDSELLVEALSGMPFYGQPTGVLQAYLPAYSGWHLGISVPGCEGWQEPYLNGDVLHVFQQSVSLGSEGKELQVTRNSHQDVFQRHISKHVLGHPFSQACVRQVGILEMRFASWPQTVWVRRKVRDYQLSELGRKGVQIWSHVCFGASRRPV